MLHNRTIPICSGLLCLAAAAILVTLSFSRPATAQVPAETEDPALLAWDYCSPATDEQVPSQPAQPRRRPGAGSAGRLIRRQGGAAATHRAGPRQVRLAGPGGVPAAPVEEPPTEAEKAIDEAIQKISKLQSVSADLEQDVEMLNQKFKITGAISRRRTRGSMSCSPSLAGLPDTTGRFLQVCDGETLWEYELVLDQSYYRKLSIKPILERLNSPDLDPEIRTKATTQMGVAGPETLLVGSAKNPSFDQKEEAVLDGKKVWKYPRNLEEPARTWRSTRSRSIRSARCRRTSPWTPSCTSAWRMAGPTSWNFLGREATDLADTGRRARTGKSSDRRPRERRFPAPRSR